MATDFLDLVNQRANSRRITCSGCPQDQRSSAGAGEFFKNLVIGDAGTSKEDFISRGVKQVNRDLRSQFLALGWAAEHEDSTSGALHAGVST